MAKSRLKPMEALTFDEGQLANRLRELDKWQASVFAAACAQRLLPLYRRFYLEGFSQEGFSEVHADVVSHSLDLLWRDLARTTLSSRHLKRLIAQCTEQVPPDEDVRASRAQSLAQYSVIAVVYALTHRLNGEVQEAVWAARQANEAIFFHVVNQYDIDLNVPGASERVDADPTTQAELRRQAADLELLASTHDAVSALRQIRSRSENSPVFNPEGI